MADYTTLDVVKRRLSITDTGRDTDLHTAITAASRRIDRICSRSFGNSTGDRYLRTSDVAGESPYLTGRPLRRVRYTGERSILIGDTTSAAVTVAYADSPVPDEWLDWPTDQKMWLEPLNPKVGWPRQYLKTNYHWPGEYLRITADWGWATVPSEVQLAASMLAARLHRRVDSPLGVTGSDEFGTMYVRKIDPDIQALLGEYITGSVLEITGPIL